MTFTWMSIAVLLAFVVMPVMLIIIPITVIGWLALKRDADGQNPPRGFDVRLTEAGQEKEQ